MEEQQNQQPQTLRELFDDGEARRRALEAAWDSNSAAFQQDLAAAIAVYEECLRLADRFALFSPNETLDDIASGDLQYLLLHYHVAELVQRINQQYQERKAVLTRAQDHYVRFLKQLDSYDVLSGTDAKLFERYQEAPQAFSTASTSDPAARRETKIARFRQEKELKQKLEHLRQNPTALNDDESALRGLHLTNIALSVHQTFQALESMALELQVLALAPPPGAPPPVAENHDARQRTPAQDGYSERLDQPSLTGAGLRGPLLSKDGKPLRPFTLLDTRQRLQQGVFRPDHSLPTMTIDEYLEEERRRGGIIEGGGAQSGIRPEPDEDDLEKADAETMKARAWDEFKEENPRGAGNTINRG